MEAQTNQWWDDNSKKVDEVTIREFEEFISNFVAQRDLVEELKDKLKSENEKLAELEAKTLSYLKGLGRDNFQSSHGLISVVRKTSVTLPKTPEDRELFFNHLKSLGLFDQMISVNSQTLNSWFKQELEVAEQEKRSAEFRVPGLKEPMTFEHIRLRKGK